MCYAIPAKLIEINGAKGVVDYFGEKRTILLDLDDLKIGDYVYAQGGVLVRKIDPEEAEEILATWEKLFFELKQTDEVLSKIDQTKLSANALNVLQNVNLRKTLKREELFSLFQLNDEQELKVLYEIANNVRQREHGNSSCVHGIIEFSNYCSQNCFYCGIRNEREINRYRLDINEILKVAKNAVDNFGFKALVLQSGEDYWYSDEQLMEIVKEVRKLGVLVFVSFGSRSSASYLKFYEAGARAALLRFETSNAEIFAKLRPGTKLQDRVQLIQNLKEIGYVIATGFLLGLPGETTEDIVNNILLTKSFRPDMYSFGPLIPTKGTPLENQPLSSLQLVLKTIAICRLVDYDSNILVTTALETLDKSRQSSLKKTNKINTKELQQIAMGDFQGRESRFSSLNASANLVRAPHQIMGSNSQTLERELLDKSAKKAALMAGANSLMINITPNKYQQLYSIYDHRAGILDDLTSCVHETVDLLYSLGRAPTDLDAHKN